MAGWPLAATAVSALLQSTNGIPIVVERSMWWPGATMATWAEAHNSPGATRSGRTWAAAAQLVVERSSYWDALGLRRAAGTNSRAVLLR